MCHHAGGAHVVDRVPTHTLQVQAPAPTVGAAGCGDVRSSSREDGLQMLARVGCQIALAVVEEKIVPRCLSRQGATDNRGQVGWELRQAEVAGRMPALSRGSKTSAGGRSVEWLRRGIPRGPHDHAE